VDADAQGFGERLLAQRHKPAQGDDVIAGFDIARDDPSPSARSDPAPSGQ